MTLVAFHIEDLAQILEENHKPAKPGSARTYTGYLHLLSRAAGYGGFNEVLAESRRLSSSIAGTSTDSADEVELSGSDVKA